MNGSKMPLRLHGYLVSTFTRTAAMACVEKGVDYELVPVPYGTPAHAQLHPFSRMPVLEHGDQLIFETLAITNFVDEMFDGPCLQPTNLQERTLMLQWIGVCSDYVFRDVVRGIPRDRSPSPDELMAARSALEGVEQMIGSPFLAGQAISLADLYLAPQISNAAEKAPELLAPLGQINEWFSKISERASFQRTAYDPAKL